MARKTAPSTLAEEQDVDVNYYVLVPFTTADAARWAAGHISASFDCHVVSADAVDQNATVVGETMLSDEYVDEVITAHASNFLAEMGRRHGDLADVDDRVRATRQWLVDKAENNRDASRRITGANVTILDVKVFATGIIERFEESKPDERTDESFLLYMLACYFVGRAATTAGEPRIR